MRCISKMESKFGLPFLIFLLLPPVNLQNVEMQPFLRQTSQPGVPRQPFQYRVPLSPNYRIMKPFNNEVLVASASTLNPMGFDFSKISAIASKRARNFYKPVVPLLWTNLPLFDTPVFEAFNGGKGGPIVKSKVVSKPGVSLVVPKHDQQNTAHNINNVRKDNFKSVLNNVNQRTSYKEQVNTSRSSKDVKFSTPVRNVGDSVIAESKNQEIRSSSSTNGVKFLSSSTFGKYNKESRPGVLDSNNTKAKYKFDYSVSNPETKDVKSHSESRDGDLVTGEYSVLEPDGYTRIVKYVADAFGFRATVRRIPPKG